MVVKHGPCLPTLKKKKRKKKKRIRLVNPSARGNFSASPTWSTRPTIWCGASPTSLGVHRNLFWQLSRDGNLHGLGMLHTMITSPKPSFRASWRVGNTVVSRRNAGWTTSKIGHPLPCQNCSQGPPAEKTGRRSQLNCPSCPPDDPINEGTELNRTGLLLLVPLY